MNPSQSAPTALAIGGEDLSALPLYVPKNNLVRLLERGPDGIFISSFEQVGPDLFRAACNMGLEGLVSKRRDRPYRGGPSKDWVKVKNGNGAREGRVLIILHARGRPET